MDIPAELIFKQIEVGPMENFIYFIGDQATKEIAVVDPAWDVDLLRRAAQEMKSKITAVFLTHGHPDHVNGLDALLKTHDVPVYFSKHEAPFYTPRCKNLVKVADRQKVKIGNLDIECLLTPGHTPGCQCFRYGNVLISGDAMFVDGCGRCDLPGGDPKAMYHSLYEVIAKLPEETVIYPGHNYGPSVCATLKSQKKTNPYLNSPNMEDFLRRRMGIF